MASTVFWMRPWYATTASKAAETEARPLPLSLLDFILISYAL